MLRKVQGVLRISEGSLNPRTHLESGTRSGVWGSGICFEMGRLVDCWQGVSLNLGMRED